MKNTFMKAKALAKKISWSSLLFLTITPVVAVTGTIMMAVHHDIHWQTLVVAFVLMTFTGLGITAGYHRLFSHKTYKARLPVRLFMLLFGAAAFEGSVLEWCSQHRDHHRYTDTDKDPYNSKRGFWYSHIGWILVNNTDELDYSNAKDLTEDPVIRFQHKYFMAICIFAGFALPTLLCSLWGDALGGFIIAGALRITLNQHFTFFINSVCHIFGEQTYSDRITAKDNWVTSLVTYGEGYHNFHHQFPLDYRNGIRFYDFDPTKWLIAGFKAVGLASELKTVKPETIAKYRQVMIDKQNVTVELPHEKHHASLDYLRHIVDKETTVKPLVDTMRMIFAKKVWI